MSCVEIDSQLVSDRPCLSRETYTLGMASGTLQGSPNMYDIEQWNGQNFHAWGKHSPNVWLQGPHPGGCVALEFEDRSLKT